MTGIPVIVYIVLLVIIIASVPLAQIAKYSWRSRMWTGVFSVLGSISMLILIILILMM